jgi:hypothetical protein
MKTKLSEYVKVAEAAEILGLSQGTVRACAEAGKIPMHKNPATIRPEVRCAMFAPHSIKSRTLRQQALTLHYTNCLLYLRNLVDAD